VFRHIRSKLIAAFAMPLAILVAVAGLETLSSLGQISSVDQQTSLASASVGPGGIVQQLQTERIYGILSILAATNATALAPSLTGLTPVSDNLYQNVPALEAQTNAAVNSFENTVRGSGQQAVRTYANAFSALAGLSHIRSYWVKAGVAATATVPRTFIANYQPLVQKTYDAYTGIIDTLEADTATVPFKVSDPTLRTGVEVLYASLEKTEAQWAEVEDLFNASMNSGPTAKADIDQALQDWGAEQSWGARLDSYGSGPYGTPVYNEDQSSVDSSLELDLGFMDQGLVPQLPSVLQAFTEPACVRAVNQNMKCISTTTVTPTAYGETQIAGIVNSRANTLRDNAVEQAITFVAVGALGALLGLVLVVLVSRSVSRPLVDLARQAEELATTTLPAAVKAILDASTNGAEAPKVPKIAVTSRDEVAEMAKALEDVNRTAVEMAAGQAALRRNLADAFVNLGRRNQNLVTRQLEYISEIELKEADPESLEELFRLDHLATRMRRNAESLLILAGSGPARQWSAPVPAMDVARAASAEVEDYKRLRLHHFDPAQITGAATTDLVHILAELIENALTFSPPGSPVDVYGRFLEGGYVIVIVDSGIGMSVDDLEVANRRLEGEGADDEVPGRYLGHFVAGRLAARHSIAISLQASHSGGLVARVKIPSTLIEEPVPDLSAGAEVRPAQAIASVEAAPVIVSSAPTIEAAAATAAPPVVDHSGRGSYTNGSSGYAGPGVVEPPAPSVPAGESYSNPASESAVGAYGPAGGDGVDDVAYAGDGAEDAEVADTDAMAETAEDADQALAEWTAQASAAAAVEVGKPAEAAWDAALPGYEAEAEPVAEYEASPVEEAEAPEAEVAGLAPSYEAEAAYEQEAAFEADASYEASYEFAAEVPVAQPEAEAGLEEPEAPIAGTEVAEVAQYVAPVPAPQAPTAYAPSAAAPTPDLGLLSPLAAAAPAAAAYSPASPESVLSPRASAPATASYSAWESLPGPGAAPAVGPAAQARSTADGLRKLTRRVPGASLPQDDESLRRATPSSTTANPLGLSGALSQYLSATTEARPEKEQSGK